MKKLTSIIVFTAMFALPAFAADMNFTPKADISLSGKIATVKTSKKFRTVESCHGCYFAIGAVSAINFVVNYFAGCQY